MTQSFVPGKYHLAAGITDGLVRVSVGFENIADVTADFKQAFDRFA
jgi:methionine-gamma-lyase